MSNIIQPELNPELSLRDMVLSPSRRNSHNKDMNKDDIAKSRWHKVAKLRSIIASLQA